MTVALEPVSIAPPIVEIHMTGKLVADDYKQLGPEFEAFLKEHGKARLLVQVSDFHGWSAGGLWEDIKFDARHFNDIDRLAIVGERAWHKGMTMFCKPFTTAAVRYFTPDQLEDARAWLGKPD